MANKSEIFTGFMPETFNFFMSIALNNNKEFFEEHRDEYKKFVYEPIAAFEKAIAPRIEQIDARLRTGRYAISRINRDTRYAKDKSPYRDHLWLAYRANGVRQSEFFTIYFVITPVSYGYGVGMYGPIPAFMEDFRKRCIANPTRITQIITEEKFLSKFALEGEDYARPRVKDVEEPLYSLINKRYFSYSFNSNDISKTQSPNLVDEMISAIDTLEPLYRFANGN